MNALNNPQAQTNEQNKSWVQDWIDESIAASNRMATDEKFRQEVAAKATNSHSNQDIQAILRQNIAKRQAMKQAQA